VNAFENVTIDQKAFAYRDLLGQDLWDSFAVSASVTVIGTPTYVGRYRMVGRKCEYQVSLISSTSIATTAGTSYINLPIAAAGIAGMAVMTNNTTDIAVGLCHIDVATSRCYLPSQVASGDAFTVAGWYEI
jgi:hypothetical protein